MSGTPEKEGVTEGLRPEGKGQRSGGISSTTKEEESETEGSRRSGTSVSLDEFT